MKKTKLELDPIQLSLSFAFLCAFCTFIIAGVKLLGLTYWTSVYDLLNNFYFGLLTPDLKGIIIGTVMAFMDGLIAGYIVGWVYNFVGKNFLK